MRGMAGLVDRADDYQRRHRVVGVPLAVVYKFFDDQGNYLAAIITYYAFVAIFPLLLIASSVLGFVLQGNEELERDILSSALSQFPIVGTQLGRPEGLQGSASAVVVGSLAALYGVVGLGQAAQNVVNAAWAVPRNSRLNPVVSRVRSFLLLVLAGFAVLAVALLSSVASHVEVFGTDVDLSVRLVFRAAAVALSALVLALMMSHATAEHHPLRVVLPGAVAIALMWQLLQDVGGIYVARVLSRASDMNGVFALVLGLVALLYVAAVMAVLGVEINAVLAKRLYPRALLTPFTDDVELTEADRRVYTDAAKSTRHKGFEHVSVTFAKDTAGPEDDAGAGARATPRRPTPPGDRASGPPRGDGPRRRRPPRSWRRRPRPRGSAPRCAPVSRRRRSRARGEPSPAGVRRSPPPWRTRTPRRRGPTGTTPTAASRRRGCGRSRGAAAAPAGTPASPRGSRPPRWPRAPRGR